MRLLTPVPFLITIILLIAQISAYPPRYTRHRGSWRRQQTSVASDARHEETGRGDTLPRHAEQAFGDISLRELVLKGSLRNVTARVMELRV